MFIYYVYAYLREDGSPYYIGKGKNQRAYSNTHTVPKPPNNRIVFLETNLSNVGACALERRYIRWYGKKCDGSGILRNTTDGGDGNSGPRSKEWCEKHSKMMKENNPSKRADVRAKIAESNKGKRPDWIGKRISEAKKGKSNFKISGNMNPAKREDVRKKMSESLKGKQSFLGKKHSEETKRKIAESQSRRLATKRLLIASDAHAP